MPQGFLCRVVNNFPEFDNVFDHYDTLLKEYKFNSSLLICAFCKGHCGVIIELRDVSKIISRFGRPLFAAACVGDRLTYSNMRALRRLGSDKNRLAETGNLELVQVLSFAPKRPLFRLYFVAKMGFVALLRSRFRASSKQKIDSFGHQKQNLNKLLFSPRP
jgi:hypothetical protein